MTQATWTRVMNLDALEVGKAATVKREGKQLALFRTDREEVFAVDNRCPHEGYPLAAGAVKDGVLTCEWHNWKFSLCDGACLLGGEDVRAYPVRIEAGGVWVDLADPPPSVVIPAAYRSLSKALDEQDWGHAARTVERLLLAGEPPADALGWGCEWSAQRAPYGFDHGLATAADVAALLSRLPRQHDVVLVEGLNLLSEPHARRSPREFAPPESLSSLAGVEAELRRRIEAEDVAGAEGWIQGALAAGAGPADVFRWLAHAATDHFLDFGHAHIYVVKAEELLASVGWQRARPIVTSLVSMLTYGTREDGLPYMRAYRSAMAEHDARREAWAALARTSEAPFDVDAFVAAILDGALKDALGAVAGALDAGVPTTRIARGLALAAAHRLWRFDSSLEDRDDVAEGWLDVTHQLTHADAVHETEARRPSADTMRGLFHAARFVQHTKVLDLPSERRDEIPAPDPELARRLIQAVTDDRLTLPIFVAHQIKTTLAAERVAEALSADPVFAGRRDRELPVAAAARFLSHPLRERRIARRVRAARRFVREGALQTRLLGY